MQRKTHRPQNHTAKFAHPAQHWGVSDNSFSPYLLSTRYTAGTSLGAGHWARSREPGRNEFIPFGAEDGHGDYN